MSVGILGDPAVFTLSGKLCWSKGYVARSSSRTIPRVLLSLPSGAFILAVAARFQLVWAGGTVNVL